MQWLFRRRAAMLGLVFAFCAGLAAAPASAQRSRPPRGGVAPNAHPRLPAGAVDVTGTITMLNMTAGTVELTTNHGTAVTLTVNSSTQLQLNGRATTITNLAVGDQAEAIYQPSNKIALALGAATPQTGVVSGAITALDLTAGTLQITPLTGTPQTIKFTAQTQLQLNGQPIASDILEAGLLATVQTAADGTAQAVAAQTPPLVNLLSTITALNVTGTGMSAAGTLQVTTPAATVITLQLGSFTAIQRDGATATADKLAMGDQVQVRYEYRLIPGSSRALAIVAKSAAPTPTPTAGAAVASLSLNPTSVKGGATSTGTVTLSAAALANGAVVTLASSNPTVATIPGSVMVAAGATTATFTVTTTTVTADTSVAIFASFGGATSMATLTVTP